MVLSKYNLTGIVLAGGKSSRFGQDKGLFVYHGKALVEHSLVTLRPLCDELFISTNNPEAYEAFGIPCIPDTYKDAGPLGGIHSALSHAKNDKTAIISCDTPHIPTHLYIRMMQAMGSHDVVLPVHGGFAEAMCSIYSKACLPVIKKALLTGKRKILDAIKPLNTLFLDIEQEAFYDKRIFHNINTREDVK